MYRWGGQGFRHGQVGSIGCGQCSIYLVFIYLISTHEKKQGRRWGRVGRVYRLDEASGWMRGGGGNAFLWLQNAGAVYRGSRDKRMRKKRENCGCSIAAAKSFQRQPLGLLDKAGISESRRGE